MSVPLIAIVNGIAMGMINFALEEMSDGQALITGWSAFRLLFAYTSVFALIVGAIFAGPAVALGRHIPAPQWAWLSGIGLLLGPVPILILDGRRALDFETLATFAALGVLSGLTWWLLVERHREPNLETA